MTVWNSGDKASTITLSGSNLIATQNAAFAVGGIVRADRPSASGNSDDWYFEVTVNAASAGSGGSLVAVGLSNSSQSLVTEFDGTNGIGYYANGVLVGPGVSTNTGTTYTAGDIIGVRKRSSGIDFTKNGTATATWPTLPSGDLFPSSILFFPNDQVTANFAGTFANLPSGSSAWNVIGSSLAERNITYARTLPSLTQLARISVTGEGEPEPTVGTGGYFPDTIAAVLQGRVVICDFLVMFDFLSGPMRLWQGWGRLHTLDDNDWDGLGQLGQISDLESAIGGTAPQARFTLSGVDPTIIAAALDESEEVNGRDCNVYMQFFDSNFVPLDNPYVEWAGTMDVMRIVQEGHDTVKVEMTAETIFARRSLPPFGNLSDREQQRFFPGDDGLKYIPSLISKTAIWPVILPQS